MSLRSKQLHKARRLQRKLERRASKRYARDQHRPEVRENECKPNCDGCPFAKGGVPHHRPVRPLVPAGRIRAVLIGESPGKDEVQLQEPFVGMTGDELNLVLAENGLPRSDLFIINAMGCQPPLGMKNEINMRAAAKACRPWMYSIIRATIRRPKPTLAMGKWAGFLATGKARAIGDARGFIRRVNKRLTPLILTWHPTYALFRQPWAMADFMTDMDRFARVVRGELEPMPRAVLKPTIKQIAKLASEPFITVDIETGAATRAFPWTGKDPTQATLKVIGLGTANVGYSMWWADQSDEMKVLVRRLLRDPRIVKVMQNGYWFDRRILKRFGFTIRNVRDTRDIRRALSTTSRLSLGYMASTYLDVPPWKEKADDGKE